MQKCNGPNLEIDMEINSPFEEFGAGGPNKQHKGEGIDWSNPDVAK